MFKAPMKRPLKRSPDHLLCSFIYFICFSTIHYTFYQRSLNLYGRFQNIYIPMQYNYMCLHFNLGIDFFARMYGIDPWI